MMEDFFEFSFVVLVLMIFSIIWLVLDVLLHILNLASTDFGIWQLFGGGPKLETLKRIPDAFEEEL